MGPLGNRLAMRDRPPNVFGRHSAAGDAHPDKATTAVGLDRSSLIFAFTAFRGRNGRSPLGERTRLVVVRAEARACVSTKDRALTVASDGGWTRKPVAYRHNPIQVSSVCQDVALRKRGARRRKVPVRAAVKAPDFGEEAMSKGRPSIRHDSVGAATTEAIYPRADPRAVAEAADTARAVHELYTGVLTRITPDLGTSLVVAFPMIALLLRMLRPPVP